MKILTYDVPDTIPGTWDISVQKQTKVAALMESIF